MIDCVFLNIVLDAWCIPKPSELSRLHIDTEKFEFDSAESTYDRAISDLEKAKWVILASALMAIVIGLFYLKLVECIARIMVWLTILCIFVGGGFASFYMIKNGKEHMDNDETKHTGKLEFGIGIALGVVILIAAFSMLWLRYVIIAQNMFFVVVFLRLEKKNNKTKI